MSTSLQVLALAIAAVSVAIAVAFPLVRPPAPPSEAPEPPPLVASRARLLRAAAELERDRRAAMISQADYDAAVGEIRRRLARQAARSSGET